MPGTKVKLVVADFPYELESGVGCKGYWTKPTYPTMDGRRKLLRKQLNCSMVMMRTEVIRHQPKLILGLGQGGLIAALGSLPLALEAAFRARLLTDQQMCTIRKSWSKVAGVISVDPLILPQNTSHAALLEALPEIGWLQPRGIFRAMFSEENNYSKKDFCAELAASMGTVCQPVREFGYISGELLADMSRPPPLYFEDSATGLGHCAICDKRGVLGRCQNCGLLLHHSCAAPELPGRALSCPRCKHAGQSKVIGYKCITCKNEWACGDKNIPADSLCCGDAIVEMR